MLTSLRLRDVGPATRLEIELSDRLNLFAGDNGLGKSFILEIAWWALTGGWAGQPAWPRPEKSTHPQIEFRLNASDGSGKNPAKIQFDFQRQEWPRKKANVQAHGLVVYARVDGGFSVWDPARSYWRDNGPASEWRPRSFHFTPETLWRGLDDEGKRLCNGLIWDWVAWQNQSSSVQFQVLERVINGLAPSPDEPIVIGSPVRLSAVDVTEIPTLKMVYGDVPLVHASAGMKRVINFAYLLTWTWLEHIKACHVRRQAPTRQLVLLIDEVESHLHPRWQRTLLPSLLRVSEVLGAAVDLQFLATTHAPLVLASVEPLFDEGRDSLFLFELEAGARDVSLQKLPWATQGDAVAWLTSPVFGLEQARSREAEIAIEAAEAFMRGDVKSLPPRMKTKAGIQKALENCLPGMDPFWPRWIVETKR